MSFGQIVKGTLLPKIPLKTLFEEDTSSGSEFSSSVKSPEKYPSTVQSVGAFFPFIKIGGQPIKSIESLTIDETGFIPTIILVFIDNSGEFGGDNFPKTNVIMNLYIKASSDKFKPIRCDFLITSIKAMPALLKNSGNNVSKQKTYTVKGELYVPNIYTNISKSYSSLNSKEALKKICESLNLGFAENECSPNDKMTWINTNMSTLEFIQSIFRHAYQDDDSFFMGFIDKYYYLNYIEVNKQLKVEEASETFVAAPTQAFKGLTQYIDSGPEQREMEEITMVNYLTTEISNKGQSNFIVDATLLSDQGTLLKKQGYKKKIYYYDHLKKANSPKDKFKDFFTVPLKSIDRRPEMFLVPEEESLAENTIKKWMNIDYGNAHREWNAARLINSQNLKELDKIKLKVELNNINFQAVRGFTIPVFISIFQADRILKASDPYNENVQPVSDSASSLDSQVPDQQLSGYYYISGAKYHYDAGRDSGFYTELFLSRREWMPSKKTE